MTAEIRAFEYSTSTGFWTGGVHINGAFKVRATRGGRTFKKIYRITKEERGVFVPDAETNEKWINAALGELLSQVVNDSELIQFLVGRS